MRVFTRGDLRGGGQGERGQSVIEAQTGAEAFLVLYYQKKAMPANTDKLRSAAETYFTALCAIRGSGGGTAERSPYSAIHKLLEAVGAMLKPKVVPVLEIAQLGPGSGHPDFGLYSAKQIQRRTPRQGQLPERGVVEVKPASDDAWLTADSAQVSKYWDRYRLVLVTNMRDFVLLGDDGGDDPAKLETLRLADSEEEFNKLLDHPRPFANRVGVRLGEYLTRVLTHETAIVEPQDLARILASYARDGLERVEAAQNPAPLEALKSALQESLGVQFEQERGDAFFRSTLVQTLFYGVFSAWVLWARQAPLQSGSFDWRTAVWHLRAPVIRALFQQLSDPARLQQLGLVELMDWTASALNRVDRDKFLASFSEGEAVQYFYEPFLEAFDPELRKQLGVWYTPPEVVRYMVARVDRALKDDLGIADGLAAENVYVLDPCCGTGAYVAETLRRIHANLERRGAGANLGSLVKKAATERVFGFEILPAPFVVAHLQVGLTMESLDAALSDDRDERAGIFLTNALTGWESEDDNDIPFPELAEERERAARVKQEEPVLVILGNPPYDGYAGVAVGEERELSNAYRTVKKVRRPEGQGLNELYVRFFRMAERRIAEKTGQGVICFISNYSWLDGLSFTGMRERFLDAFDVVRIDSLNGDKFKTGKTTPDGKPDPSIFSTAEDLVGIQVGTAITMLIRRQDHEPTNDVAIRQLWGQSKPTQLTESAESEPRGLYDEFEPDLALGLPFAPMAVSDEWSQWPSLPELFLNSFSGVETSRDSFLVDIDDDALKQRMSEYSNAHLSHQEIGSRYPVMMATTPHFDPASVRNAHLSRTQDPNDGFWAYSYRPFDTRWIYWETGSGLLNRPRPEYRPHVFKGNLWLSSSHRIRKGESEPQTAFTRHLASYHLIERASSWFPAYLRADALETDPVPKEIHPNLSDSAKRYLDALGLDVEILFHHVLATLHSPAYREENAGALRMEWPRIPLPGWPDGNMAGAADQLRESADKGRQLAALLDSDTPVDGVTAGELRPELSVIAVPTTALGRNMTGDDYSVTAGWGHYGQGEAVMPGQGRVKERDYTAAERGSMADSIGVLGEKTFDVYLNDNAWWGNIPAAVWNYKLGGYQVLKKWLSYRERKILDRPLKPEEVRHFTDTARRIAAILAMT